MDLYQGRGGAGESVGTRENRLGKFRCAGSLSPRRPAPRGAFGLWGDPPGGGGGNGPIRHLPRSGGLATRDPRRFDGGGVGRGGRRAPGRGRAAVVVPDRRDRRARLGRARLSPGPRWTGPRADSARPVGAARASRRPSAGPRRDGCGPRPASPGGKPGIPDRGSTRRRRTSGRPGRSARGPARRPWPWRSPFGN